MDLRQEATGADCGGSSRLERDFEKGEEGEVGECSEGIKLLRMCKGKGDGRVDDSYGWKVSLKNHRSR